LTTLCAYLIRDGEVFQITHDHTLVQSLLDEGKLTAEEAASHPQRQLLRRAPAEIKTTGPAADPAGHEELLGRRP
jgi:PPM family protein phosphatase